MKEIMLQRARDWRNYEAVDSWQPIGAIISSSTVSVLVACRDLLAQDLNPNQAVGGASCR
jgi:hypothetical protein